MDMFVQNTPGHRRLARILLLAAIGLVALPVTAAELLVIEDKRCAPCLLFDRQVAAIYARTTEGASVPLRKLPFGRVPPAPYGFVGAASVAPTFVLVDEGREIGRFEGYSSDELFWMSLTALLQKLPGR